MDQDEVGKQSITKLAKPLLQILDAGFNVVDLHAIDYKEYIHIRLNHVTQDFEEGEMVRRETYHELELCKQENFQENAYMKQFWQGNIELWGIPLCVDHLDDV